MALTMLVTMLTIMMTSVVLTTGNGGTLTCPEYSCSCSLDQKGRRLVVCSTGGLLDPLPLLDMPSDMEILIVNATDDNYNTLTLGPIFKRHRNLEEIHVTHSRVPALGAHSFWGLRKLTLLNVSHNELSTLIETDFRGPDGLSVLNLSHNNIESVPSAVFRHVTRLRMLDLSHNKIPELAPRVFLGLNYLHSLDLSYNPLGDFPYNRFSDTPLLQELKCVRCGILGIGSNVLSELPHLRVLDLRHNRLTHIPSVSILPKLHLLYLDNNHITAIKQGTLLELSLKKLSLSNNNIDYIDIASFIDTSISSLDLSYNKLSLINSQAFDIVIIRMKELYLDGNNISIDQLLSLIPKSRQLRRLGLGNCGLLHIPPELLKRSRHLKFLNISSNFISKLSPQLLLFTPNLQVLDLSDNSFNGIQSDVIDAFLTINSLMKVKLEKNPWLCEECEVSALINWLNKSPNQPNSLKACTGLKSSRLCLKCSGPSNLSGEEMLLLNEEQIPTCASQDTTEWALWMEHNSTNSVLMPTVEVSDQPIVKPEPNINEEKESVAAFFKDHLALLVGVGCGLVLALLLVVVFAVAFSKRQSAVYFTEKDGNEDDERKEKLMGRNNNDSPVIQPSNTEPTKLPAYSPMAISVVHARNPIKATALESTYVPSSSRLMDTIDEA